MQIVVPVLRTNSIGRQKRGLLAAAPSSGEREVLMIPGDLVQPRFETRLNLLSRRILMHLGTREVVNLAEVAPALGVPAAEAALAVGWLARSRAVDLEEAPPGRIQVVLRRPIE